VARSRRDAGSVAALQSAWARVQALLHAIDALVRREVSLTGKSVVLDE